MEGTSLYLHLKEDLPHLQTTYNYNLLLSPKVILLLFPVLSFIFSTRSNISPFSCVLEIIFQHLSNFVVILKQNGKINLEIRSYFLTDPDTTSQSLLSKLWYKQCDYFSLIRHLNTYSMREVKNNKACVFFKFFYFPCLLFLVWLKG